jgi:hypothetical protein
VRWRQNEVFKVIRVEIRPEARPGRADDPELAPAQQEVVARCHGVSEAGGRRLSEDQVGPSRSTYRTSGAPLGRSRSGSVLPRDSGDEVGKGRAAGPSRRV